MIDHYATEFSKRMLEKGASLDKSEIQIADRRVESIFQSILLRSPSEAEVERSLVYLRSNSQNSADSATYPWVDFIKALLSTNEFCFID